MKTGGMHRRFDAFVTRLHDLTFTSMGSCIVVVEQVAETAVPGAGFRMTALRNPMFHLNLATVAVLLE